MRYIIETRLILATILVIGSLQYCICLRDLQNTLQINGVQHLVAEVYNTFSVKDFGAKGDGITDDTMAFEKAWTAACGQEGSELSVPAGSQFVVGPIEFVGPCKSTVLVIVDGTILAPANPNSWKWNGKSQLQWINLSKLNGVSLTGKGVIDCRGQTWWLKSGERPAAVRFYGSQQVKVSGITLRNSPKMHLKFDNCNGVVVDSIIVSSPGDSPNTDGVHLQNSQSVQILRSQIACGDDCVSIETGCYGIEVSGLHCGPSHGISIGSLGEGTTKACVSGVKVSDSTVHDSANGVRIKTWQGGFGSVSNVTFSGITVKNVKVGVNIDQYYCEGGKCSKSTSAVAVSGVTFENIQGSYTEEAVKLACSNDVPCMDISLVNVNLTPTGSMQGNGSSGFSCSNAYGSSTMTSANCLLSGKPNKYSPSGAC